MADPFYPWETPDFIRREPPAQKPLPSPLYDLLEIPQTPILKRGPKWPTK
jgi:hypothetical protein